MIVVSNKIDFFFADISTSSSGELLSYWKMHIRLFVVICTPMLAMIIVSNGIIVTMVVTVTPIVVTVVVVIVLMIIRCLFG